MKTLARVRSFAGAALAASALWLVPFAAIAQTPGPTSSAPVAEHAVTVGVQSPAAVPSLAEGYGAPLEPFLFVFLLLGGGLICLIAAVVTNENVVSRYSATNETHAKETR